MQTVTTALRAHSDAKAKAEASCSNASRAVESGNAAQAQAAAKPKASFHKVTVALANLTGDAAGGGCCGSVS